MNAIDFLMKEHTRVRTMLKDISDDSHHFATKRKNFNVLAQELLRHETMEHEIWYPHFRDRLPDTVKHLLTEEKVAEIEIKKLDALKTQEAWEEYFLKFKKDVDHHAQEEKRELFPEVRKLLTASQLEDIGHELYQFKKMHS